MAIRALYLLVEILAAHDFKTVAIDEFIGIEESTLAAALLWVERRGGKIDDFLHFLSFTEKSLA